MPLQITQRKEGGKETRSKRQGVLKHDWPVVEARMGRCEPAKDTQTQCLSAWDRARNDDINRSPFLTDPFQIARVGAT